MLLVDAALDGDEASLHEATRKLQVFYRLLTRSSGAKREERTEDRGRVLAFLDVAVWALERALSLDAMASLEGDSAGFAFLKAVHETPGLTNHDIAEKVGLSESEASRVGRRLADAGLAAKRRVGRTNNWEMTPKGLQSLDLLEGGATRFRRPNLQRT
jgi:DNA-binding transcriptional ArsR family regulator